MHSKNYDDKLSSSEKRDLVIQAGIEAIPYVGGSLSTLYFGAKEERRFKRLEKFYKDFSESAKDFKDKIAPVENHDREALSAIIEELNEKVEREQLHQKREYLKTYLRNTLIHPIIDKNYDERRFFLESLSAMSSLECEVLIDLSKQTEEIEVSSIQLSGVDKYAIIGAVGRLKTYGFLESRQIGIADSDFVEIYSERELVKVSAFGRCFCRFCLGIDE